MELTINNISLNIGKEMENLCQKLKYVINTFISVYKLENSITISYGSERNGDIHITPGNIGNFFEMKKEIPEYSFIKWNSKKIPILFNSNHVFDKPVIKRNEKGYLLNGDILMSAFYFLSCWQEYVNNHLDEMNRFPYRQSFLREIDIFQIPIVNYYFDILAHTIQKVSCFNGKLIMCQGKGLKVGITHDIDSCHTGSFQDSYRQFRAGEWLPAIKKGLDRIIKDDIWFNFEQLLHIEKTYDVQSSYYFIPSNKPKSGYPNADYDFHSKKIQGIIEEINQSGHEVGIHGSIGTGYDVEKLSGELSLFPNKVHGGRFHYLMMSNPDSFNVIEKSGMDYDTSLGFAEHVGFRNGFCFPYFPYDFENERPFSFLEFPFQVMDQTLIQPHYMGLKPGAAIKVIRELIDEINKFSGYFIFIWHNNTITGYKYEKWKKVFLETIKYGQKMNAEFQTIMSFYNQYKNK